MTDKTNSTDTEPRVVRGLPEAGSASVDATAPKAPEPRWFRTRRDISGIVLVVLTVVLIVLTADILCYTKRIATKEIPSVQERTKGLQEEVVRGGFTITSPRNGDTVKLTETIHGVTPFRDLYHYIVIRPIKVGTDFIEPCPVAVGTGGSWTGVAKFGNANLGIGELYMIRCLATRSKLQPGAFTVEPRDAVFSDPVIVVRGR